MAPPVETSEDWLLSERVRIVQPVTGYRAGLDAVLLAASLHAGRSDHVLDLGCGAGAVTFCAASRLEGTRFTGLERDRDYLSCFEEGRRLNRLTDRVEITFGDAEHIPRDWENRFDQVVSNPPFFEPGRITAPGTGKIAAYLAHTPIDAWLKAMLFVTKPKGRITLIHRAGMLAEILSCLHPRAGEVEVFPVRRSPSDPAKRVLVTARKGLRKGETVLHAGLSLHPVPGESSHTEAANKILSGGALSWRN